MISILLYGGDAIMTIRKESGAEIQKASTHDVFVRNHLDDTGDVPFLGPSVNLSPDIIAMENSVIDPSKVFGGANWNEAFLEKHIVRYGQDNYIYVRVANRGTMSVNVKLSLHWALSHECINPKVWTQLGSIQLNDVLPDERRVAGPVVWTKTNNPGVGAYFLASVVSPLAIPDSFDTGGDYYDFLRQHNNICHRNIAVLAEGMDTLPL